MSGDSSADTASVSPEDLNVLREFYNATNGEHWELNTFGSLWFTEDCPYPCTSICTWIGLTCKSIPGNYSEIQYVSFAYQNTMIGTIPESFYNLTSIESIVFQNCMMYGTISERIVQLQSLDTLSVKNNHFSGTLPKGLSKLSMLNKVDFSSNKFRGNPDNAFDNSVQTAIYSVYLSSNQFTGTIPLSVSGLPSLKWLDLSWNCFHGSIPDMLCEREKLIELTLTGANAENSCLVPFIHMFSAQSYLLKQPLTGTIPKCLFEMPSINTLNLDKLGLSTTIPEPVIIGKALQDINLNNNALYGSIPNIIQRMSYGSIDLSYNKLSGILSEDFGYEYSVSLDYNRLSSVVPRILIDGATNYDEIDVSILEGNAFACLPDRSDLPKNDPYYPKYQQCGSTAFNNTLYGSIGVIGGSMLVLLILLFARRKLATFDHFIDRCSLFRASYKDVMADTSYHRWLDFVRRWVCVLTAVILVVLVPVYVTLSAYYATQTYKYAWVVSGVYLNGVVATVMLMLVPVVLAATVYFPMIWSKVTFVVDKESTAIRKCFSLAKALWMFVVLVCVLADIALVVAVNTGYIALARIASESVVQRASIAMSIFKIVWNYLVVRNVLKYLTFKSPIEDFETQQYWFTRLETSLVLFNNIIAPYIATLLVSANCLQQALLRDNNSAFMYSYQCSSTFITTYASVFLFMFALTAVGFPLIQGSLMWLHFQVYPRKESSIFYSYWEKIFSIVQPKLLFPLIEVTEAKAEDIYANDEVVMPVSRKRFLEKRLFCADLLVVDMVSMFAIMLTFGAVVPAVAVVGCAGILSVVLFNELMIGRGICYVNETYDKYPDRINKFRQELKLECRSFSELFKINLFVVLPFVTVFYGLLVFDMLGDTEGAVKAIWAPMLVLVVVSVIWVVGKYVKLSGREGALRESYVPLLKEDLADNSDVSSPTIDL